MLMSKKKNETTNKHLTSKMDLVEWEKTFVFETKYFSKCLYCPGRPYRLIDLKWTLENLLTGHTSE